MPQSCYLDNCHDPQHAQGLCSRHYTRQRKAAHRNGTWESVLVPAELMKSRVQKFTEEGYTYTMLEALTGIERNTFIRLFTKNRQLVTEDNLERLLRLPLVPLYELWKTDIGVDYKVPTYLASRRVRALMARGWTTTTLAKEVGLEKRTLQRFAQEEESLNGVFRSNLLKVVEAYDRLWDKEPPKPHRRAELTRYIHWPMPLEWDDEKIDLPGGEAVPNNRARNRIKRERDREYRARKKVKQSV